MNYFVVAVLEKVFDRKRMGEAFFRWFVRSLILKSDSCEVPWDVISCALNFKNRIAWDQLRKRRICGCLTNMGCTNLKNKIVR
jgi:hypothetical protein